MTVSANRLLTENSIMYVLCVLKCVYLPCTLMTRILDSNTRVRTSFPCMKALSSYKLAAEDFESAKMLKLNDPNFSINYRNINNVAYIEIDNEPDTIEEFMPIFPSFDV